MLVARTRLAALERERDEWRRRAEHTAVRPRAVYVARRRRLGPRLLAATWLLVLGLVVGGVAIPRADDAPVLHEDYPGCIGKARYENPIAGNQYQELVNALYACEVYRAG